MTPLLVGALKANLAHSEGASGAVGLLKLTILLEDERCMCNSQLRTINPLVEERFGASGCFLLPLASFVSKAAGIGMSSFGFSGTISHAVAVPTTGNNITRSLNAAAASMWVSHKFAYWQDQAHPFAQRHMASADESATFYSPVSGVLLALVANHIVQGRMIFPGAGYLEMVRAAGAVSLATTFFLQPLPVDSTLMGIACTIGDGQFEVHSRSTDAMEDTTVHCAGTTIAAAAWHCIEQTLLRIDCRTAAHVEALYDGFDSVGLQYGPGYRTLVHVWAGPRTASSRLRANSTQDGTCVHPANLDDALCTGVAMGNKGSSKTRLPFAVDNAILQDAAGKLWTVRSMDCQVSCPFLWLTSSALLCKPHRL